MKETPTTFELREPPSPESLVPDPILEPWMLFTAVGFLALALVAAFLLRKRYSAPDPSALRTAAHKEASTLISNLTPTDTRDAAVCCSLILRRYLATAAGDPALFETHEEFVSRRDSLAQLTPHARTLCAEAFTRLASLKYSPADTSTSPQELSDWALSLLDQLHHGFTK